MEKYRVLVSHYLSKAKGQYVSFCLITLIAAAVFSIGLTTVINFGGIYKEKFEKYNCADVFYTLYDFDWSDDIATRAEKIEGVTSVEVRNCIMMSGSAKYANGGNTMNHTFFNMDEPHKMNELKPLGKSLDLEKVSNPIYVSYWVEANKCKLGDIYQFTCNNKTYEFTVAGFVEDLMYGNNNCGNLGIYLPESGYQKLSEQVLDQNDAKTISLKMSNVQDSKKAFMSLMEILSDKLTMRSDFTYGYYEMCCRNRTITTSSTAAMLTAFSVVLLAISMLVMNFRIRCSINEEIQNMGILKAVGYTGRQIVYSIALPYIVVAMISVGLGLLLSYAMLPAIASIFNKLSGLKWEQGADLTSSLIVIFTMLLLVIVTALLSAARIKRMQPIDALKSGIRHHNFKKNFFPLSSGGKNVHILIAMKNCMEEMKQNLFLFVIFAVLTFSCVFAGSGFYNSMVEMDNFITAMSDETPSVSLMAMTSTVAEDMMVNIQENDMVGQAIYYDMQDVFIGGESICALITDDYTKVTHDLCFKGRNPAHDNEVALGAVTADYFGYEIGDTISLKYGGMEENYIIVGLVQSPNTGGTVCEITTEGFRQLNSTYEPCNIYVYLNEKEDSVKFVEQITEEYDEQLVTYTDFVKMIEDGFGSYLSLSGMMISMISMIMLLLVAAVLYLIIRTTVHNRKQELGILKAVGYTSGQLIGQLAGSLTPVLVLGTLMGAILGQLLISKVWLACFYSIGVRQISLRIPTAWTALISIIIIVYSVLIAIGLSGRIKKIESIKLICE